mmetsp:Transcript_50305/g.164382  ORF Transcript_50305/g.164382 Transcript_50305/m.164382 type:complete len:335 (+) Transcript_50305:37-1041(+)
MLYRFVALGVALACGIWTGLAVQENYDEICDELRKSIADTDMPRADREKIAEAVVQFLPAGLPFAAFLVTYMAMALLGYLISCVCSCCGCCGGCCGCGPGHEYAMMPPTVAIGGQYRVMLVPPPTAPRGTWSDGLCSCLSDAPVALVACCVPPLLPAMLYERVTGHAGSCKLLTVFVGGLWLLATFGAPAFCQYGGSLPSHVPNECRLVNAASTASMVCMVLLVWTVRSRVRQAFHIPPSCACDACDDGACACCRPEPPCNLRGACSEPSHGRLRVLLPAAHRRASHAPSQRDGGDPLLALLADRSRGAPLPARGRLRAAARLRSADGGRGLVP